ncbi:MBL fold metallo-hydrolase [Bacteroidota bacterium]
MRLYAIETGNFKLDGGAMFGVVPKSLWSKQYPADENNLINLAMRALLIDDGQKRIIIDNGLGEKLDEKFLSYYYLNGDENLEKSLKKYGYTTNDITDVIMTHLHFDHCGGGVKLNNGKPELTFKNATYITSKNQWEEAMNPNPREEASFLKENLIPIEQSGQLKLIENDTQLTNDVKLKIFNGHTAGQVIPFISYKNKTIVYVADLIPSIANIPISWIPAYDINPITAMEEKKKFLNEAVENNYILFFEHDINYECCTVKTTEKGVRLDKTYKLTEII